ncbi:MAG: hypothetical protein A2Y57_02235 [Candidatus Woykebacteria bacterium RBG_13_40_7b]|uniref:Response regulatory domain-containing protein n=1 Tax=Candidatus Woykebacteria bacterium RBG_13_40_7b TaxID=1802594 RepID=A0A1G1W8N6_9BACT|nr:MAG: hypothetical protein A2Y57_02235 [Candidatus Woykebacteria bacterium RBG_13_40_7b]
MAKVLLIEDDLLMVRMYKKKFIHDGFETETALDGEEGLEKVRTFQPDIIVLDIMMPHMSGVEFLEHVREENLATSVPVLILTNLSTTQKEVEQSIKLGAKEILLKTEVTPIQLVEKIKQYLK